MASNPHIGPVGRCPRCGGRITNVRYEPDPYAASPTDLPLHVQPLVSALLAVPCGCRIWRCRVVHGIIHAELEPPPQPLDFVI